MQRKYRFIMLPKTTLIFPKPVPCYVAKEKERERAGGWEEQSKEGESLREEGAEKLHPSQVRSHSEPLIYSRHLGVTQPFENTWLGPSVSSHFLTPFRAGAYSTGECLHHLVLELKGSLRTCYSFAVESRTLQKHRQAGLSQSVLLVSPPTCLVTTPRVFLPLFSWSSGLASYSIFLPGMADSLDPLEPTLVSGPPGRPVCPHLRTSGPGKLKPGCTEWRRNPCMCLDCTVLTALTIVVEAPSSPVPLPPSLSGRGSHHQKGAEPEVCHVCRVCSPMFCNPRIETKGREKDACLCTAHIFLSSSSPH